MKERGRRKPLPEAELTTSETPWSSKGRTTRLPRRPEAVDPLLFQVGVPGRRERRFSLRDARAGRVCRSARVRLRPPAEGPCTRK